MQIIKNKDMKTLIVFQYTVKSEPEYESGHLIGFNKIETLCGIAENRKDFESQVDPEYMEDVKIIGEILPAVIQAAAKKVKL